MERSQARQAGDWLTREGWESWLGLGTGSQAFAGTNLQWWYCTKGKARLCSLLARPRLPEGSGWLLKLWYCTSTLIRIGLTGKWLAGCRARELDWIGPLAHPLGSPPEVWLRTRGIELGYWTGFPQGSITRQPPSQNPPQPALPASNS